MKYLLFFIVFSGSVFTGIAGVVEYKLNDFTAVEVIGNYVVELKPSSENKIIIDNKDSKVLDNEILAIVTNGKLKIQIQRDTYLKRNIKIILFYKSINQLIAKRGVVVNAYNFNNEELSIQVNSNGFIKMEMSVKKLEVVVKAGGAVNLKGQSIEVDYSIQTGGTINGRSLKTINAKASVQMGGEIIVNASNQLDAIVKTGGTITYIGEPKKMNKTVKFGGSITKLLE